MPSYLATQIIEGRLLYKPVVERYPQFKDALDEILRERGYAYLIEE